MTRRAEILDRAAAFYEQLLWESDEARAIRSFLDERGLAPETLREFQVGYAPIGWFGLQEHMRQWRLSPPDLREVGLVQRSHRSERFYDYFRSRIIFPVRDPDGEIAGFAGLALHYGPSWPRWLTSPEDDRFRRGSALFGIDRAAEAIRATGRAVVSDDSLEVIGLHQRGRREAVAVIRSSITDEHVKRLTEVAGKRPEIEASDSAWSAPAIRVESATTLPARERRRAGPHRRAAALGLILLMVALSLALWAAIPLGWLWIGSHLTESQEPSDTVYFVIGTGILGSMAGVGYLLVRLNRLYMRLLAVGGGQRVHVAWLKSLRTSEEQHDHGVLDLIMIGSALTAILAMAVWFFAFARAPT
jgi:hypothetical protein